MAKVLVNDTTLTAIADAIRAKTGSGDTMLPGKMATLIAGITSGDVRYGEFKGSGTEAFNIGPNVPDGDYILCVANHSTPSTVNKTIRNVWGQVIDGVAYGKMVANTGSSSSATLSNCELTINRSTGDVIVEGYTGVYFYGSTTYKWIFLGGGAV